MLLAKTVCGTVPGRRYPPSTLHATLHICMLHAPSPAFAPSRSTTHLRKGARMQSSPWVKCLRQRDPLRTAEHVLSSFRSRLAYIPPSAWIIYDTVGSPQPGVSTTLIRVRHYRRYNQRNSVHKHVGFIQYILSCMKSNPSRKRGFPQLRTRPSNSAYMTPFWGKHLSKGKQCNTTCTLSSTPQ